MLGVEFFEQQNSITNLREYRCILLMIQVTEAQPKVVRECALVVGDVSLMSVLSILSDAVLFKLVEDSGD